MRPETQSVLRPTPLLFLLLLLGCSASDEGPRFTRESARTVASPAESGRLAAYFDVSAPKLYLTNRGALASFIESGRWPALAWQPGAPTALLVVNGDTLAADVEEGDGGEVAAKEPEAGDFRLLISGRRRFEQRMYLPVPPEANGARVAGIRHVLLVDPGDVIAPEVYVPVIGLYWYIPSDCSAGYLDRREYLHRWVAELEWWPLP